MEFSHGSLLSLTRFSTFGGIIAVTPGAEKLGQVARWLIDKALAGEFPTMRAILDIIDGPTEYADSDH
jgi:hypothetical protein